MNILLLIAIPVAVFATIGIALYRLVKDALTANPVEAISSSVHRTLAFETGEYSAETPEPVHVVFESDTSILSSCSTNPTINYPAVAT